MTEKNNDRIANFLKYLNTGLISIMTLILLYGVNSINKLHDSVDALNIKMEVEATQRQNNSQVILDHEGRIRSLENDMKTHVDGLKDWTTDNFVKK